MQGIGLSPVQSAHTNSSCIELQGFWGAMRDSLMQTFSIHQFKAPLVSQVGLWQRESSHGYEHLWWISEVDWHPEPWLDCLLQREWESCLNGTEWLVILPSWRHSQSFKILLQTWGQTGKRLLLFSAFLDCWFSFTLLFLALIFQIIIK